MGQVGKHSLHRLVRGEALRIGFNETLLNFLDLPLVHLQIQRNCFIHEITAMAIAASDDRV